MKGFTPQAYEGWCQPVAIPIIPKPGEYTMRSGTRWSASCGTWKRMPYQTFPLITTYVRGALPYIEHEKLMSTNGLAVAPQRAAVKVRVGSGSKTSLMVGNGTQTITMVGSGTQTIPVVGTQTIPVVGSGTQTIPLVREVTENTCMKPRVLTKVIECEDTKYIPKVEVRTVQRTIEVASKTEKRFVPREVPVDTPFIVPRFEDRDVPVVVSNTISPEIEETEAVVEVPVARYVPHLVPINVYVPRAVAIPVVLTDESKQEAPAALPTESLQQLIKELNPHLEEIDKFNAGQNIKFQELLEKSQKAANFAKCPVPEPQSTPILKITEIEPEGEESDHLVKQICFSTGGYQAAEVESLFTALTATSTTDSEADTTSAHKGMSGEQTDPDTHDDMLSAATGASDSQRCTSVISGKDATEGVAAVASGKASTTTEERKSDASKAAREAVVEETK